MLVCYFLGSLFTDSAPGCYVRCGFIGSPVFSFPVDVGGVSVHLSFVVCYCFLFWFFCVLSNSASMKSGHLCSVVTVLSIIVDWVSTVYDHESTNGDYVIS